MSFHSKRWPIKLHPPHLPLAHQEAADIELEEMLKTGVIEPSDSPLASAVVMVPKKFYDAILCGLPAAEQGHWIDESLDLVASLYEGGS